MFEATRLTLNNYYCCSQSIWNMANIEIFILHKDAQTNSRLSSSGGQIQIMIWFKSWLNHMQWFDFKKKIMIWFIKRVIWFDLIWNFMIWFEIIPNHKNFRWYAQCYCEAVGAWDLTNGSCCFADMWAQQHLQQLDFWIHAKRIRD